MKNQLEKSIAKDEMNFELGDKRLNCRAKKMIETMSKNCDKQLTQKFSNASDLRGAYRFFNNPKISAKNILKPHKEEAIKRCQLQAVVLVIQDSSDISFDYMKCLEGFNPLHPHVDKGYRIHPCLVTTETGTPLGVLDSFDYSRAACTKKDKKEHRNQIEIQKKESYRWLQGYREACKLKRALPEIEVISIADRESDIYEHLIKAVEKKTVKAELLIRAQHNRSLVDEDENINKIQKKLIRGNRIATGSVLLNKNLPTERIATIAIRATTIVLRAPKTEKKKGLKPVTINAVLISEIDPPKDCTTTIDWVLLTTLPITTEEEVLRIAKLYSQRWSIEIYFKVLKSGCGIDKIHFQSVTAIKRYIAFAMLVAWKVMLITYLPREFPDAPCSILFTDLEWRLAHKKVYKDKPIPEKEPTLKEAVMLVAMLGGYQKRKDPPGIQTIWRGLTRLLDMLCGYELAQDLIVSVKMN
jgi:hypothetical protein